MSIGCRVQTIRAPGIFQAIVQNVQSSHSEPLTYTHMEFDAPNLLSLNPETCNQLAYAKVTTLYTLNNEPQHHKADTQYPRLCTPTP
jgi:hypothetical protein